MSSIKHGKSMEAFGVERQIGTDEVAITVASPDIIRSWSKGEVKLPETINYRTFKPEKGGLFCERIFGPTRDWECSCGKFKRIKNKGTTCDRCGVEVTLARVRRERMGHIDLAVPVSHIWFYKCTPSRLGLILNLTGRELERILYYEDYVVIDPGKTGYKKGQVISEDDVVEAELAYGEDSFTALMGAEAIQKLLEAINLEKLSVEIEKEMNSTKSKQLRKKHTKRLKLVQGFLTSKTRPEWMILNVLPVIPPDLRPLVPLDGGRFATSDLNDLYRRVINRNNRLKQLMAIKTPDVIIRNEKRMLQEAVDALFDNGRHGRAVTGASNRPLKSLSDTIKGKSGRFRQNLLGKRVDYSGRSVIVIGPELQLHQCGLPKKMALVLFEPFIIRRLKDKGYAHTVRSAKKLIEQQTKEVWDILEEVTKGHPVLLNRAPTLHRLSVQAFEPLLIEGEALRIHPLVCTAYNADFDGDQMAVHVPLSIEAQMEARMLMLAPNNIFSPSSGKPITNPSQDIPLGCYYMTQIPPNAVQVKDAHIPLFADLSEVEMAFVEGKVHVHTRIRLQNPDFGKDTVYGDKTAKVIETTVGRVSFNQIWSEGIGFLNKVCGKKQLSEIIWKCYKLHGQAETVQILDRLKEYGFRAATRAGVSIGISDMIIPEEKQGLIDKAYGEVKTVEQQHRAGVITGGERQNKLQDIWSHASEALANAVDRTLKYNHGSKDMNPVFMMVDSGARGNRTQVKQLAGMRGLMSKPSGEIIERPILANFREGLSVLEYFISTHGARKGLADTALKTADSGYLTRKLVDAAQDVIVTEPDCGTVNGIVVESIYQGDAETVSLAQRIIGRTSCETVKDPVNGAIVVKAGQIVDEDMAEALDHLGVEKLKIRSALTCECRRGICASCYGRNLATGRPVKLGEAVGIIAAQSIGEPGTQLTMRTFHIGGTASQTFKQPSTIAKSNGTLHYQDLKVVVNPEGKSVVLNKNGSIEIHDSHGQPVEDYQVVMGSIISIPDGGHVKKGETFITWDHHSVPIITEKAGKVSFVDLMPGVTIRRETDETTGMKGTVVIEHKEDLHPQIVIHGTDGAILASYSIPAGAHIEVKDHQHVDAGMRLARTPRKVAKTKDITGGLPRVAEIFEARRPKEAAEIAKIDGIVDIEPGAVRGKRRLIVRDPITGSEEEHLIPLSMHVIVFKGDRVEKGQPLTEGSAGSQEILDICGAHELQERLLNEVQDIYRGQGVEINDKHIEIIIRQMLRKVRITEPGGTSLLWGEQIDRQVFEAANAAARAKDEPPAKATPVLLGITRASLETDSFISAASFQDTTRVLTEAATLGKVDKLRGFKENVIMGHLIPAGTGFKPNRDFELVLSDTLVSAAEEVAETAPAVASEETVPAEKPAKAKAKKKKE